MVGCRLLTTVGVMVALAGFTRAEDTDGGGAKKQYHAARGRVTDVASDGSTITVEVRPHQKKNVPAPATPPATVEKKFKIDKDTKILFVSGKKGERQFTPATFADLHKGEHVVVVFRAGQTDLADKVAIVKHKKQAS
jgi:hypothetical protein